MRTRARSAATSRWRCRTTSSTAPTRRSLRSARSHSGSQTMSSSDLPDSIAGNVADWTRTNAEYTDPQAERRLERRGDHLGRVRRVRTSRSALRSATFRAWTSSSSVAARPTSRPGSRSAARVPSGSTPRRRSSRRRDACRSGRASTFRSSKRRASAFLSPTVRSTWFSPSTAPRCGRPEALAAGSGAPAAPRRAARLSDELRSRLPVRA